MRETKNVDFLKWKHKFVHVNGLRMHYVFAGQGLPVILLHGFPQYWYAWRHQISPLAEHFTVIAPDLRGYGRTDKPENIKDYSLPLVAKDIVELIHSLGYEKAHIVGHDWGGGVGWQLALEYPEVVDRLVVLNCPHPAAFRKALKTNRRQLFKSWYMFFFQIPYVPELIFKMFDTTLLKAALKGSSLRKNTFTDHDLQQYLSALRKPGAFTAAINYYRASFRNKLSKNKTMKHRKITAPTQLIWGESDSVLGKELTYKMEPFFSNHFEIHYIPQCSHWVNEEQPDLVNQLLIEHLTRNYPSSSLGIL